MLIMGALPTTLHNCENNVKSEKDKTDQILKKIKDEETIIAKLQVSILRDQGKRDNNKNRIERLQQQKERLKKQLKF